MAPRTKRHADEDQISAVGDWISDCERTYLCAVRIVIAAPIQAGRVTVRVEACDVVGDKLVGVRVRRRASYPNSCATSLCGALLKELISLHKDLEDYQALCEGRSSNPAV